MADQMININKKINVSNIYKTDLHMHTIYCDGNDTPEQMVRSAIEKGMECIGFSGHSYVEFDAQCGMNEKNAALYFNEIRQLKVKYKDRIRIYCGIERDDCSERNAYVYDYVIGSVHYLRKPICEVRKSVLSGFKHDDSFVYVSVDDTPEELYLGVKELFDNDYIAAAENYFDALSDVVEKTGADIIGHFDLISKFNERFKFFDEKHSGYAAAWQHAADRLITQDRVFEINTGGMSRGWRSAPYPSPYIIDYIKDRGGRFILSSDSHSAENIAFGFETIRADLR